MAYSDDELLNLPPVSGPLSDDDLLALPPAPKQPPVDQNTGTAGDLATSVKRGILDLPGVVTGLADLPFALAAGIRPVSTATEWVGDKLGGFRPGKWADEAKQEYSPGYQQAQQEIDQAWDDPNTSAMDVAKAYVRNPAYVANAVAESVPSMLAGGLAGRTIMGAGAVAQAVPAVAGAEGAASRIVPQMVGYLERKLGEKTAAAVAGGAGEGLVQAGSAMNEATGEDQRKNAIAALGSGLVDAIIGAGAGSAAQKLGFETIETAMAKGFNRMIADEVDTAAKLGQRVVAKGTRMAGGAVAEGILQELPQSAQEQVWANYAAGKDLWDGVPRSAVEGALAGMVMGAGANVVTPDQTKANAARDKVQSQTLTNITKLPVTVENGVATVQADQPFTMPAADLAEHFVSGGTLETLPKQLWFGERAQFQGQEALAPQPVTTQADIASALDRAESDIAWEQQTETALAQARKRNLPQDTNRAIDAAMQEYAPVAPRGLRQRAPGTEVAITSPDIDRAESDIAWEQQTEAAKETNQRKLQSIQAGRGTVGAPFATVEPATLGVTPLMEGRQRLAEYQPEAPGTKTPEVITNEGQPFASASAAKGAAAKTGGATYEIIPQGEGFVAQRIDAGLTQAITKQDGTGFATEKALQQVAARNKIDLTGYRVAETNRGFIAVPLESAPQASATAASSAPASSPRGAASLFSSGPLSNPLEMTSAEVPKFKTKAEVDAFKTSLREQGYDGVYLTDKQQSFSLDPQAVSGETAATVVADLKSFLGAGYDNLVKAGKLEVVQSMDDAKATGIPMRGATGKVAGVYNPKLKKVVLIADNISQGDGRYVMTHEGAHALLREDPVFMKQRSKILADFLALAETSESVRAAIARVPSKTDPKVKDEEALAHWLQDRKNYEATEPKGVVEKLTALYKRLVSAVKAALFRAGLPHGRLTEMELARIFVGGVQAWSMRAGEDVASGTSRSLFSKLEQIFKPVDITSANFKKWFGNSVVTENGKAGGKPLVVYHGTPNGNFEERAKRINTYRKNLVAKRNKVKLDADAAYTLFLEVRKEARDYYAGNAERAKRVKAAPLHKRGDLYKEYSERQRQLDRDEMFARDMWVSLRRKQEIIGRDIVLEEEEVDAFLRRGDNDSGYLGSGFYFTADRGVANQYAQMTARGRLPGEVKDPYVYEVYISLKNPFYEGKTPYTPEMAKVESEFYERFKPWKPDLDGFAAARSQAKAEMLKQFGFDGVIGESAGKEGVEYVVFNNTQIKSAISNTGDFSEEDSRLLFSAIDDTLKSGQERITQAVTALANPKSTLRGLYVQHAPKWLAVTPLRTLVQTFGKTIPQVKSFAEHLDAVVSTKTAIVDDAKVLYDKAKDLAEKGPGLQAFNWAAAVASFNRMTPWLPMLEQDWVDQSKPKGEALVEARQKWIDAGMKKATGKTFDAAYKQAADLYNGLGNNGVKEAYQRIVDHLGALRKREKNNLLAYIEKVSKDNPELRKELMARFNTSFSTLNGAYWPLSRVGDFRLEYTDSEGFRTVKHYTTLAERRADMAELTEQGAKDFMESFKDKRPRSEVAIPSMLMDQLSGAVLEKYLDGVDQADESQVANARAAAQDVIDDMNQIWLRWQPETSALANSIRRGNVKGFHEDSLRSYLDYTSRHASNIAWTEQGRKIEADLAGFSEDISKAAKKPGSDTTLDKMILNDLRARVNALRTVQVGTVASVLGKVSTAYYMTSPSIALVQMSQLGVLTLPKLAVKYGAGRAGKALATGIKEAFTKKFTRDAMFADTAVNTVYEDLHRVVTAENRDLPEAVGKELGDDLYSEQDKLRMIARLNPYQKQLLVLRESMAKNLLDISAAHEAYELTQGKNPDSPMAKAFRYAMLPMSLSELASRKATILSTYELANAEGKNFFAAMGDIGDVVNDTLYSYAKENKPVALQGGVARVIAQFQWYRIMTAIRLAQLFNNSIRGESPEVKEAARKEFVGIMGMTTLLAGVLGTPLGMVFSALSLFSDEDEPEDYELLFQNWLRDTLGETGANVVAKGLPTLAGTDLSKRLGLSDIYGMQGEAPAEKHGRDLAAWYAGSLIGGPIFSIWSNAFQAYDEMVNKGNYMRGLETAMPKPIKDAMKAYRLGVEGLKTGAGKKLLSDEKIGPDELIMQALGFSPDEVAAAQSANTSLTRLSTAISERRGRLIRDAAKAVIAGDRGDTLGAIRAWNAKNPRFAIRGQDIRPAIKKMIRGELGVTGVRERAVAEVYEVPVYVE